MPDDYENANGLDPQINDANLDLDEDTFSNIGAYRYGSGPNDIDSVPVTTEEQFVDLRTNRDDGYQRLWNGFKVKGIVAAAARMEARGVAVPRPARL